MSVDWPIKIDGAEGAETPTAWDVTTRSGKGAKINATEHDNSMIALREAANELHSNKLDKAQNLSDVADAPTAFGNIKQAATDEYAGVVELASSAEAIAGEDTERAVTPSALAAALVVHSETITLEGMAGKTVTHNKGDTSYHVRTEVSGLDAVGRVGEISYVKAANTVVIYNSGPAGYSCDVVIAPVA